MASAQEHPAFSVQSASRRAGLGLEMHDSEPRGRADGRGSLDRLIDEAAQRITRFVAPQGFSASAADGLIVDIRSHDARDRHGLIPGSLHIPWLRGREGARPSDRAVLASTLRRRHAARHRPSRAAPRRLARPRSALSATAHGKI